MESNRNSEKVVCAIIAEISASDSKSENEIIANDENSLSKREGSQSCLSEQEVTSTSNFEEQKVQTSEGSKLKKQGRINVRKGRKDPQGQFELRKNVFDITETLLFDNIILERNHKTTSEDVSNHLINRFDYTWVFLKMFLQDLETLGHDCKNLITTAQESDNNSIVKPTTSVTGTLYSGTDAAHMISVKLNKNFIKKEHLSDVTNKSQEETKQNSFDILYSILGTAEIMPKIVNRSFDVIFDDATSKAIKPETSFKDYKKFVKEELTKMENYVKGLQKAHKIIEEYGDEENCPEKYNDIKQTLLEVFLDCLGNIKS